MMNAPSVVIFSSNTKYTQRRQRLYTPYNYNFVQLKCERKWKHHYFSHSEKNFRKFYKNQYYRQRLRRLSLAYLEIYLGILRFLIIGKITSYHQEQGWHKYIDPLYSLINTRLLMNINNKIPQLRKNWNEWQFKYCVCKLLYADGRLHARIIRNHHLWLERNDKLNFSRQYKRMRD